MSSERFEANCKRCGRVFEYGLFSRSYPYCVDCKVELDQYAIENLKDDKLSDVPSTSSENEVERQQRYTREDHNHAIADYYRRNRD
jgi:endogenous inhibitor of DNA gyrase (YacG/DUF329 family)